MRKHAIRWLKFTLRWGIAVVGITWVVWNLTWRDRVLAILDDGAPVVVDAALAQNGQAVTDQADVFSVIHPDTGQVLAVPRVRVLAKPDPARARLLDGTEAKVLGLELDNAGKRVQRLVIAVGDTGPARWVNLADTQGPYQPAVVHPRVQTGVRSMVLAARAELLWAAVLIFPITILLTGYRWFLLMRAMDIHIPLPRAYVLNMVGLFYNSFMPGSTGGDLIKAYYASKHTTHRTRAVMSVLIDRILGLLALILIGGSMAAYQWHIPACRKVAIASGIMVVGAVSVGLIIATPSWRRYTGVGALLRLLPMQRQVNKAVEAMEMCRRKIAVPLLALAMTLPVHITVILAGTFAGLAFGLPVNPLYYWAAVPVIILVGAIPISPQGAGVMEFFAVQMLSGQGATVAEALALTMSIRLVHMIWNLPGGIFVLRGGFHSLSEKEEHELEIDEDEPGEAGGGEASQAPTGPGASPRSV